jgi:glycosyltransferase involved in cell wall biosynthesis
MEDVALKGLDIAAKAMGIMCETWRFDPKPVLVVRGAAAGTGDEVRERLRITAACPSLQIRVKEYSADADRILSDITRSSLVLMPSRAEGFGLVALEALEAGTPVLMSDQSGAAELLREVLPEAYSRIVVPVTSALERDAQAWAKEIEFVLRDRQSAFAYAQSVRDKLKPRLSWDRTVSTLVGHLATRRR